MNMIKSPKKLFLFNGMTATVVCVAAQLLAVFPENTVRSFWIYLAAAWTGAAIGAVVYSRFLRTTRADKGWARQ